MIRVTIELLEKGTKESWDVDAAVMALLTKKDGAPETARAQVAGQFNMLDLLVLGRMIFEHIERTGKQEFGVDGDLLEVMREMMNRKNVLDDMEVSTKVAN